MKAKRIHRKSERTPEEMARMQALREKFQRERPTQEQIEASGEYDGPVPQGMYFELMQTLQALKREREKAGLSLTALAERAGLDKASVSRLENGHQLNPTLETLYRYATAMGKTISLAVTDPPLSATKA